MRNNAPRPPSPSSTSIARLYAGYAVQNVLQRAKTLWAAMEEAIRRPGVAWKSSSRYVRRKVLSTPRTPTIIILLWCALLYWGEVRVFDKAIAECDWRGWETWSPTSNPHHLALLSDPQLVDPHTYPGRPWPLSTLTVLHTDLYLRRSYQRIQRVLDPHTTMFLGDLFDGGREWATAKSQSPEAQYRRYRRDFWLKEYDRFARIFLRDWAGRMSGEDDVRKRERRDGRRIIASLPGNHDLGFGKGIQRAVRDRFVAYFGEGNRVDVVGNHSIVSLDSVSLSAQEEEPGEGGREIWEASRNFLNEVGENRAESAERHLQLLFDGPEMAVQRGGNNLKGFADGNRHSSTLTDDSLLDLVDPRDVARIPQNLSPGTADHSTSTTYPDIPTLLLTHVPLYRPANTPCGPLREHGASISIARGYQYQNTLSPSLSADILARLGATLTNVFSGDDHDYCEVFHRASLRPSRTNGGKGVKEITIKSMSWAMGVRRPGFELVSLWNPVDEKGRRQYAGRGTGEVGKIEEGIDTVQTQLCLLPDQLAIFLRYLVLLLASIATLAVRAVYRVYVAPPERDDAQDDGEPLLPMNAGKKEKDEDASSDGYGNGQANPYSGPAHSAAGNAVSSGAIDGAVPLQSRSAHSRRISNGYAVDGNSGGAYSAPAYAAGDRGVVEDYERRQRRQKRRVGRGCVSGIEGVREVGRVWGWDIWCVARVVLVVYVWMWVWW